MGADEIILQAMMVLRWFFALLIHALWQYDDGNNDNDIWCYPEWNDEPDRSLSSWTHMVYLHELIIMCCIKNEPALQAL